MSAVPTKLSCFQPTSFSVFSFLSAIGDAKDPFLLILRLVLVLSFPICLRFCRHIWKALPIITTNALDRRRFKTRVFHPKPCSAFGFHCFSMEFAVIIEFLSSFCRLLRARRRALSNHFLRYFFWWSGAVISAFLSQHPHFGQVCVCVCVYKDLSSVSICVCRSSFQIHDDSRHSNDHPIIRDETTAIFRHSFVNFSFMDLSPLHPFLSPGLVFQMMSHSTFMVICVT